MKVKHTKPNVAQILQNSVFWTQAMFALRAADSELVLSRNALTGVMTADVQDTCAELHTHSQEISAEDYADFVLHMLKHCRKHRSSIYHDHNFAKGAANNGRPRSLNFRAPEGVLSEPPVHSSVEQAKLQNDQLAAMNELKSLKEIGWGKSASVRALAPTVSQNSETVKSRAPLAPNRFYVGSHKKEEDK